ncbi:MAG: EthD family reductase [Polyangiales bacterium]
MTTKPVIVYVTYTGEASARFDRDYYLSKHLPLAQEVWGPTGLESATAFFPAGAPAGTIAIAELKFRDQAAVQASLASPGTPKVLADVKSYTDIVPVMLRGQPL